MNHKYSIPISITLAFVLTIFSLFFALGTLSLNESLYLINIVIAWNVYLAGYLITKGLLPSCRDCEMTVLAYIAFYRFIIGQIVYSILILCGILSKSKLKNRNLAVK
ncbi:hypothetical protein BH24ACI2_BH24ACI2_06950 [soil metagenome]|jgi:hypothetical protein